MRSDNQKATILPAPLRDNWNFLPVAFVSKILTRRLKLAQSKILRNVAVADSERLMQY